MAVRDGERWLEASLTSLWRQGFEDFEIIVVDDGSVDATPSVLAGQWDPRLRVFRNETPQGLTLSLIRALSQARGRLIARQDADDLSEPHRLARQVAHLNAHPEVVVLGSSYRMIDDDGTVQAVLRQPADDTAIRWQMLFHNAFCHSSVMVRRQALEETGGYAPDYATAQDYDLWSRVLAHGRGANLDEPLVRWRSHDRAVSQTRRDEQRRAADRIAGRQLAALMGRQLDQDRVSQLRDCFYRLPQKAEPEQLAVCRLYLAAAERFGGLPGVDGRVVGAVRRQWCRRAGATIAALPVSAKRSDDMGWLLRKAPLGVARGLLGKLSRSWRVQ